MRLLKLAAPEEASLSVDFKTLNFAYPVGILRLRRFFEKSQWFPPEQLRAYREKRLRRIIRQCYYHVPYYRRLFDRQHLKPRDIRKIEHLSRLPFLSKEKARTNESRLRADNAWRFRPVVACTSGTSGVPLRFLLDKPSNILEFVYYWRHWSWAGYRLGNRFAELRYDFFLMRPRLMDRMWHFQPVLQRLLLSSLQLSRERIGEYAAVLRKLRPRFLHGLPTHLHTLSLFLREAGLDDIELEAVFTTGETVMPHHRDMIEKTFGCRVLDSYGHMERCVAISQCPQAGYHLNAEYGILELADERRSESGEVGGRIVATSLHKMAMPFLKYEMEDELEVYGEERRCPCGRTLPLVKALHGRRRDVIRTPDGREITWQFVVFHQVRGVRLYQFVQDEIDQLTVRIVKRQDYTPQSEDGLKFWLNRLIGDGMSFRVEYVSENDLVKDSSGRPRQLVSTLT